VKNGITEVNITIYTCVNVTSNNLKSSSSYCARNSSWFSGFSFLLNLENQLLDESFCYWRNKI